MNIIEEFVDFCFDIKGSLLENLLYYLYILGLLSVIIVGIKSIMWGIIEGIFEVYIVYSVVILSFGLMMYISKLLEGFFFICWIFFLLGGGIFLLFDLDMLFSIFSMSSVGILAIGILFKYLVIPYTNNRYNRRKK